MIAKDWLLTGEPRLPSNVVFENHSVYSRSALNLQKPLDQALCALGRPFS